MWRKSPIGQVAASACRIGSTLANRQQPISVSKGPRCIAGGSQSGIPHRASMSVYDKSVCMTVKLAGLLARDTVQNRTICRSWLDLGAGKRNLARLKVTSDFCYFLMGS